MLQSRYNTTPAWKQLLMLVSFVAGALILSSLLGIAALVPIYGSGILQQLSTPDLHNVQIIHAMRWLQACNSFFGLALPAMYFVYLTRDKVQLQHLFTQIPAGIYALAVLVLVLIIQPAVSWLGDINSLMKLPPALAGLEQQLKAMEENAKTLTEALLSGTSYATLFANLVVFAVIPALAEEWLFRGALCAWIYQKWGRLHLSVWITAIVFSAIHMQFYGFLPRMLLGVVLGYLFMYSGNLWLAIWAHFLNNAISVVAEFMFRRGIIADNAESFGSGLNHYVLIISVIISVGLIWLIRKQFFSERA